VTVNLKAKEVSLFDQLAGHDCVNNSKCVIENTGNSGDSD